MACRLVLRLGSHLLAMTSLLPPLGPGGIHNLRLSHFHQGADVMPMAKDKLPNDRPKQNIDRPIPLATLHHTNEVAQRKRIQKRGAPGYQLCHSQASVLLNGLVSRFHLTNSLRRIKENANNTMSRNKEQLGQSEKFAEFTPYSKVIQHLTNPWAHFYPTVRSSKTSHLKSCLKPKDAAPDSSSFGQGANPATMPLQRSLKPWGFQSIQGACDGHCVECGAAKQETFCLVDKTDLHWLTKSRWATSTFGAPSESSTTRPAGSWRPLCDWVHHFDLGYLGIINVRI